MFPGRETVVGTPVPSSDGFGGERWQGGLRLDFAGRDSSARVIIIEVRCGQPDHKHPGQLVSYAKAANAAIAVWLVADADPLFCVEHLELLAEFNEFFAGRRVFIPVTLTLESEPTADPPAPATPVLPAMRRISLPDIDNQVTLAPRAGNPTWQPGDPVFSALVRRIRRRVPGGRRAWYV